MKNTIFAALTAAVAISVLPGPSQASARYTSHATQYSETQTYPSSPSGCGDIAADTTSERRCMTMEEAVLGRGMTVKNLKYIWKDGESTLLYKEDNEWYEFNPSTGTKVSAGAPEERKPKKEFAYTKDNNLFFKDSCGKEHAITDDANPDIVNGSSVSRNEFGIENGIFVSPDSTKIAFYTKDESRVTSFPLLDITTRTGSLRQLKYPMNGMASETVKVSVFDLKKNSTVTLDVSDFDQERYLTNVTWAPDGQSVFIQVLDRSQKHCRLNQYNASTGAFMRTFLTEDNDRYVEPQYPLVFLDNDPDKFLYCTDNRDGYRNLYLCSLKEGSIRRLTDVDADVEYVGQNGRYIFYYSYEVSPIERHLFKVDIKKGSKQRLTPDKGVHNCSLSSDGRWFIDNYTSFNVPRVIKVSSTDGKKSTELFRAPVPNPLLANCRIEMGTVKSADGLYDNHYSIVYPLDFDPSKKYPAILYVYGGPHLQLISDVYRGGLSRWDILMAQKGYIVMTMDGRGTPNRGAAYEKAIHRRCGKAEMEDQMEGMKWLMSHSWVDKDRIGVHGWSYGGFMTISLMVNYPEVFKVGVAGGPVIDWKWYEVMYGERYMETEATNPDGFAATSLIHRAKDLKGKLLICQGAIDDTVLWEHSLSFVEACIKAGVQVDYFPYPTHKHNVIGKDRVHLMNKVTMYFDDFLLR